MIHPSEQIVLAVIGSFTSLGLQAIQLAINVKNRKKDKVETKILNEKVVGASKEINEKLDINTSLTGEASHNASAAYSEANNFNARFYQAERERKELKLFVELEMRRMSANIHRIANYLQSMNLENPLELESRSTLLPSQTSKVEKKNEH